MALNKNARLQMEQLPKFLRARTKHKPNLNNPYKHWNIVKGDKVVVTEGPQKGQQGIVEKVIRHQKRIIVEGVNMRRRNLKKDQWEEKGKFILYPASIHYSNVNLVDPVTGLPTRVGRGFLEDGSPVRISRRSGAVIPKPVYQKKLPENLAAGEDDTVEEDVLEVTFKPFTDFDSLDPLPDSVIAKFTK